MIETMVEFGETQVGEIMTPRTEICGIENTATVKEARDLMLEEKIFAFAGLSGKISKISKVYLRPRPLQVWADGKENSTIDSLVRDVYFVPETKLVEELLEEMQHTRPTCDCN